MARNGIQTVVFLRNRRADRPQSQLRRRAQNARLDQERGRRRDRRPPPRAQILVPQQIIPAQGRALGDSARVQEPGEVVCEGLRWV